MFTADLISADSATLKTRATALVEQAHVRKFG
jgi:hypothetical protein